MQNFLTCVYAKLTAASTSSVFDFQHFVVAALFTFLYLIASIVMVSQTCGQAGYAAAAVSMREGARIIINSVKKYFNV